MIKSILNTCLVVAILALCAFRPVQLGGNVKAENVIAVFIYNFTKFLDWGQNGSQNFVITVLGTDAIVDPLNKIASIEKVKGKTIIINEISDLNSFSDCNILYLSGNDPSVLSETIKKIKGKKVLLVTNAKGFAEKGSAVNFVQIGDKIKFEINRKELETKGIIPNSSILSLAYKVYE